VPFRQRILIISECVTGTCGSKLKVIAANAAIQTSCTSSTLQNFLGFLPRLVIWSRAKALKRKYPGRGFISCMRLCLFWSGTLLTIIVAITAGCSADNAAPRNDRKTTGREVSASQPGAIQEHSQIDELLRKTQPNGSARVIVLLRIPPGPDATREQRIKSVQQALLAELARVPHQVLRTYTVTPAVALEASHQALQVLRDSPRVLRVEEDALAKPSDKPS
jgi:hypothetical protein